MNGRVVIVGSLLGAVAAGGAWWQYRGGTRNAAPVGILVASGRLEGRTIRVAAETGGRIRRLAVERGDDLAPGQLIAEVDPRDIETAVSGGRAAVAAAEAGIVAADAHVAALEAQRQLAETEAARYRRLFEHDAGPRQMVDRAETERASVEGQLRAARASRALAARQADLARAELAAAELRLEKTIVTAPAAGQVTALIAREGETVPPGGPVVQIVDVDPMKLRIYLPLESAGDLLVGVEARVYVDAYPDEVFQGTVERIADEAEFTPKDVHMPDERSTLVYAVDIRVPNLDGKLKDGFPADTYLRRDPSARWPDRRPWQ